MHLLGNFFSLPASLVAISYALSVPSVAASSYAEQLHLKPLPGRALYAGFNFTASTPLSAYETQNFNLFPRSLGQILQHTHTAELHLRFALGRWDEDNWGERPRRGTKEGGTGVELWAWLEAGNQTAAQERWSSLVNSLSGLFCASLNFIEQTQTTQPILTFEPEGHPQTNASHLHLMHGMLPHEVVCTENLTPFLKLLPCKGKAGIASLLDGHKVFDANWQTMAIDAVSLCRSDGYCMLQLEQTIDIVLDLDRSMRPRDNPIPRPVPIEEISCDDDKDYNAQDTCFPKSQAGATGWSLSRIFGRAIKGSCPLGNIAHRAADVTLEADPERDIDLLTTNASSYDIVARNGPLQSYRLHEKADFDMQLAARVVEPLDGKKHWLHVTRQMTGYGQERGGMHATIANPHHQTKYVVYMESLPWFLRPYMHTLEIRGAKIEKMYYKPAADRRKGTQLELLLAIPPLSIVDLKYDFEKAILRYTEYPPDANRGFDIAPAIVRVIPADDSQDEQGYYLRTTSLLLPLPTPDFSMPYNVIILTSTVIALGFGSIFNLLIRRFVLLNEVPKSPLADKVKKVLARFQRQVASSGASLDVQGKKVVHADEREQVAPVSTGKRIDDDHSPAHLRRAHPNADQGES